MRDGLRAIHDAGPGEGKSAAGGASGQPATGRGGNGTHGPNGERHDQDTLLDASLTAMGESTRRLVGITATDRPAGLAAISEAVWLVTIVDAALIRYHPQAYDRALGCQPAGRRVTEGTLAGLRFVRNQIGYRRDLARYVQPAPGDGTGVAHWRWQPVPGPAPGQVPPRALAWETSRHQGYQAHLAGHPAGQVFTLAGAFLTHVSASVSTPAAATR